MTRIGRILVAASAELAVDPSTLDDYCRSLAADLGIPVVTRTLEDRSTWLEETLGVDDGSTAFVCVDDIDENRPASVVVRDDPAFAVACVDLRAALHVRGASSTTACVAAVRGRGLDGIRWAAKSLIARAAMPVSTEPYGRLPDQVGDLRLPDTPGPHPVVVVIHGGGWRECFERDLMDGVAVDLAIRGYATWNLEYRRVGPSGGGWPQTAADVAMGLDAVSRLAETYPLDPERVAVLGHSAGGQLALWAAARGDLPDGAPGAGPAVVPSAAFSLSGALDLEEVASRGTGDGAAIDFMGGLPEELPDRYAAASPLSRLPLASCRQLIAYGTAERVDLIDGNRRYCVRGRALGDDIEELVLRGADHFQVIDPRTLAWTSIAHCLQRIFPAGRATRVEGLVRTAE